MSTNNLQSSHLEKILMREWARNRRVVRVSGTQSPLVLGQLLCGGQQSDVVDLPHLILVPDGDSARRAAAGISSFSGVSGPSRRPFILPDFDLSPYSGLDPSAADVQAKLKFLYHAQNSTRGQIFIAPVLSLLQYCLPYEELHDRTLEIKVGSSVTTLKETLLDWGFENSPVVEDVGQFAFRGGIVDVYSSIEPLPLRIELFGDEVFSIREFAPDTQTSVGNRDSFKVIPVREHIWSASEPDKLIGSLLKDGVLAGDATSERESFVRALSSGQRIVGIDFLTSYFWKSSCRVLDHFSSPLHVWIVEPDAAQEIYGEFNQKLHEDFENVSDVFIKPPPQKVFATLKELLFPEDSTVTAFSNLVDHMTSSEPVEFLGMKEPQVAAHVEYPTYALNELKNQLASLAIGSENWGAALSEKIRLWKSQGFTLFVGIESQSQGQRLRLFLERAEIQCDLVAPSNEPLPWNDFIHRQKTKENLIHILPRSFPESTRMVDDKFIFIQEEIIFGRKSRSSSHGAHTRGGTPTHAARSRRGEDGNSSKDSAKEFHAQARRLSFAELSPGDCVVHTLHGVGIYDGLKKMNIGGVDSEFLQLSYKDKDKLYLPVYRIGQIQKYAGHSATTALDKLGGIQWEKTTSKARGSARDLAMELLSLYAKRKEHVREIFRLDEMAFLEFENKFPFEETDDQARAIDDFLGDLKRPIPMDRLICGDVGFGKTEVAMRAAFSFAHAGKQVALLAPTTVLVFQHLETFQKRFKGWPIEVRALNRFISAAETKKILAETKEGKVQILIGTHRLLSKDLQFKDLGLLIIDEEQRFGVAHKERLRALKASVDTIALSATPIPRTLNMSLSGIRDLSLINTAPVDRLPVRTFVTKWNDTTIRNAILAEIKRGGQVYFIHNRVQSIYAIADELRKLVPEARIKVGHGQQEDEDLERTMVSFFHKEIDVLLCTTIVESGMDVPSANTIIIDQAHTLGLSQLYQLRGRVGRSRVRAYCYLLTPRHQTLDKQAQERLKVIHDHTALGSGIRIAQYDLELRGSGDLLGHDQSGHINSVGYEMFMDLLNEEIEKIKGNPIQEQIDPEINLKVPALIPDDYVADIRMRLSFYKAMSEVRSEEELESIEGSLRDQFGPLPPATVNLLGIMILRIKCKALGVKDLSAGMKSISLLMSDKTPLSNQTLIRLATRENKKYSITPDSRLNIRLQNITWESALQELILLEKSI